MTLEFYPGLTIDRPKLDTLQLSSARKHPGLNGKCLYLRIAMNAPLVQYWDTLASPAMGHWGTCPLNLQLFKLILWVTSKPHKLWLSTSCDCLSRKNRCIALSLFTAWISWYFGVSPFNYFLLVLCPSSHQILATPLLGHVLVLVSNMNAASVMAEAQLPLYSKTGTAALLST